MASEQGYGIKCEPDMSGQSDYYHPLPQFGQEGSLQAATDMDLSGFLDMDDKTLSELAGGVPPGEWSSLFNGQLDGLETLDPTTGIHSSLPDTSLTAPTPTAPRQMDRWLLEETHKLERQQKIQQQKLMELQQTLLKTEILKNQLQIASISHSSQSPTATTSSASILNALAVTPSSTSSRFNFNPPPLLKGSSPPTARRTLQRAHSPVSTPSPPLSVFPPTPNPTSFPEFEPDKRKVHNLIEKKYRCSINDRIGLLRDMVTKHSKDSKRQLQKSAVLQKTIDYIRHLENTIRRLQEENHALRDTLAKVTGKPCLPSLSPPDTPHHSISPRSSESGDDSGHPSSPEYYSDEFSLSHNSSPQDRKMSILASHLMQGTNRASNVPRFLMCVLMMSVFFINPMTFTGRTPTYTHQGGRTLSAVDSDSLLYEEEYAMGSFLYFLFWGLRILIAAGCFGWVTLRSMPRVRANSQDAVRFWRFRKQAENDLQKGEFVFARENLEVALAVTSRPIPTSYYGIVTGLLWSLFSHLLFQVVLGRFAVWLASLLQRGAQRGLWGKKSGLGVTFADVSETYHLLHQINMATTGGTHLHGMGFYLALNALNFAEADRPFHRLVPQQLSEMFFTLGLQCHFSFPYASTVFMWWYFFLSRNVGASQFATPLKWTVTPRGKRFLMSAQWAAEVKMGSKFYHGAAALPIYSMTRAYCKELLRDTFNTFLLPNGTRTHDPSSALQDFKAVLQLAKEANSSLLACVRSLGANAGACESGFDVIQWWASVGLVACYWSKGEDSAAEDYYATIEGDSTPVPTALHLAFKATRLHRRPSHSLPTPVDVLLQLCSTTSNSLKSCVSDVLQDHYTSVENELHQLGLLLACDWLLDLQIKLWETHGKESGVTREVTHGFHQDLNSLSQLVTLLPHALPRLRLYKGCYQLIAGANPMHAQTMLSSTGRASLLRRRAQGMEAEDPDLFSPEHAMAKVMAYKHLPSSLELPGTSVGPGRQRVGGQPGSTSSCNSKQTQI